MVSWNNLDTLSSYKELADVKPACLTEVMSGDNGAERVKNYSIPMATGLSYNYASKQVDENVLAALEKLADEAQLADKFKALYNGEVVNTGEKRLVLHHMTRGQLGDAVEADGVDKRTFYKTQQERIAEFANISRSKHCGCVIRINIADELSFHLKCIVLLSPVLKCYVHCTGTEVASADTNLDNSCKLLAGCISNLTVMYLVSKFYIRTCFQVRNNS